LQSAAAEQIDVATMRDDVMCDGSGHDLAVGEAQFAKGLTAQLVSAPAPVLSATVPVVRVFVPQIRWARHEQPSSVLQRRRLVGMAHRSELPLQPTQLGIDPIKHPIGPLLHELRNHSDSLPIEQRLAQRLDQSFALFDQSFALFDNQIDDVASQIFSFSREPLIQSTLNLRRNALVEESENVAGRRHFPIDRRGDCSLSPTGLFTTPALKGTRLLNN
jgi:hypothetical protein